VARVSFGLFEFDPAAGTLVRDGRPIRIQPQPARVLGLLVERADEIVSRAELRRTVWGDDTFVDFERGLNFCIAQIRSALGDSAESPRYIETVPRRGYRFIAPVRREGEPAAAAPATVQTLPVARRTWTRRSMVAVAIVLITATVAALGLRPRHVVRVAVVPFDNETGSAAFDDVAGGVADATVARLATPERLRVLSVIGNAAVLRRPRAFRDLKVIGQELGAEYVVLAQVKRDAQGMRVIAHLIRVRDEVHVWANTFDRPAYTLAVQQEIAEAIASAVTARLAAR
jgi:DNA-binding winged helix-turn-helix (wHTH) protein/TolB-like protein